MMRQALRTSKEHAFAAAAGSIAKTGLSAKTAALLSESAQAKLANVQIARDTHVLQLATEIARLGGKVDGVVREDIATAAAAAGISGGGIGADREQLMDKGKGGARTGKGKEGKGKKGSGGKDNGGDTSGESQGNRAEDTGKGKGKAGKNTEEGKDKGKDKGKGKVKGKGKGKDKGKGKVGAPPPPGGSGTPLLGVKQRPNKKPAKPMVRCFSYVLLNAFFIEQQ